MPMNDDDKSSVVKDTVSDRDSICRRSKSPLIMRPLRSSLNLLAGAVTLSGGASFSENTKCIKMESYLY